MSVAKTGNEVQRRDSRRTTAFLRGAWVKLAFWPILAVLAVASLWAFNAARFHAEEHALVIAAMRDADALSRAYATQLVRSLEKYDELTLYLKHDWERSGGMLSLEELHAQGLFNTEHFSAVLITDASGTLKTATFWEDAEPNFAEREYFQYHRNSSDDALRVGLPHPAKGSGNRLFVPVTRRLDTPAGAFDGVIVVAVANDFLTPMPSSAGFGAEGLQALVGNDNVNRVVMIGGAVVSGANFRHQQDRACMPANGPALIHGGCFSDGVARFVALSPLGKYPYHAVVGISRAEALQAHVASGGQRDRLLMLAAVMIGLFALFGMTVSARLRLKRAEASEIRKAYRLATEHGRDGFYLLKKMHDRYGSVTDFQITDCNARGAELCGKQKDAVIGTTFTDHYGKTPYKDEVVRSYAQMYEIGDGEDEYRTPAESLIKAEWVYRKYARTFEGLAVTLRDISEKVSYQNEILRMATHDGLTGLPNRQWLIETLPAILARAERDARSVAVFFIDLDNFKNVNDAYGHPRGDAVLKCAAKRLQALMRPGDHVVRLGGDEFTIVLDDVDGPDHTADVAARIVAAFTLPIKVRESRHVVGTSIGIAMFPTDGRTAETLLKHADIAMYSAKSEKGRYVFFDSELSQRRLRHLTTEQELALALSEDRLVVFYQPRFAAQTGELVGMEALARWLSPVKGITLPAEFIPVAEASDLIIRIGEVVARSVARQLRQWLDEGLPVVPVSVNVSARQFNYGGLKILFTQCLEGNHLPARLLEIEIAESAIMSDVSHVAPQLAELNALGLKTHIDAFGTGYSSLSVLQTLSLDVLKIDGVFITQLGRNHESEILYRAMISMAHALEMKVVVEGVETREQLARLQRLGCDEVQGYLFSAPLSASEATALLRQPAKPGTWSQTAG